MRLCELPVYQDIAQAHRGITHREHLHHGEGVMPSAHFSAHYLRIAKNLFREITDLLDRFLERIADDDQEQLASPDTEEGSL